MLYALGDKTPQFIGDSYFIADTATLIGDVTLGTNVGIWFNAVLRGDEDKIVIGDNTNIQDNCVLHVDLNCPLFIGDEVTIGHGAIVHGCTIADECLIGMNAVILDGAKIGKNCIIGANTLITQNQKIPANSLVVGSSGKVVRKVTKKEIERIKWSAKHYADKIATYLLTLNELEE